MCKNLVEDLKNSKKGLMNLKETYNLDIKFCCDIDTLLQMIDAKLSETNKLLPPPPPIDYESDSNNCDNGDVDM